MMGLAKLTGDAMPSVSIAAIFTNACSSRQWWQLVFDFSVLGFWRNLAMADPVKEDLLPLDIKD